MTEAQSKEKLDRLERYAEGLRARIANPKGKRGGPKLLEFLRNDLEKTERAMERLKAAK